MSTKPKAMPRAEALEFFSLEGKYQIAPETTPLALHNDIDNWLDTAGASIDMVIDGINYNRDLIASNLHMITSVLYGIRRDLSMVTGAMEAIYKLEHQP